MTQKKSALLARISAIAAFPAAACSSSSKTTGGGADAAGGGPDCTTYCNTIMANCKSTTGASGIPVGNQQYTDTQNCLNSCKAIPPGTSADTSGNTLGC